ncbi:MAG: hypothetical protein HYX91_04815 [Chloroflexi bacterium]|nr:hypothetical protein [Chloroflexota bacterium]
MDSRLRGNENAQSARPGFPGQARSASREKGQLLLLAIILLGVGTLVVMTLIPYASTMLASGHSERELAMARYAAEAGISRVTADMVRGADAYGTTYTTTSPHKGGQPYSTFQITTSYSAPAVTVNSYSVTPQVSLPTPTQAVPATQQNYVDPGVTHPNLATIPAGYAYLMRLYNVKAGTIQVNWAYSPAGISRMGVWAGIPTSSPSNDPIPPGQISSWPTQHPILETGFTPANATYNRTQALVIDPATDDSGGVYTIVFDNSRGVSGKTTAAFSPSGGTGDTWVYIKSYKDYIISATTGGVTISAYVRQVPGYSEPPAWETGWSASNPSFITNKVYVYSWNPP